MTDVAVAGRARKRDSTPLATRPDLLAQVHPDDRERAAQLSSGSSATVRWLCEQEGHYVPAEIRSRAKHGHGCAYCTNKAVLVGFNDLGTKASELVGEWHPRRNGDRRPEDFTYGSPEVVWWLCAQGHEWPAQIRQRVGNDKRKGTGCAECKGLRPTTITEDGTILVRDGKHLLHAWPEVIDWWSPINRVRPDQVYEHDSRVRHRFTCPVGHNFTATAQGFLGRKDRCHICTGREVAPGVNTLDVTHPHIAAEWDTTGNGFAASQVTWANRNPCQWRCTLGHSYSTSAWARVSRGTGCHYCHGRKVLSGFNDLATAYRDLIPEWDDDRSPATVYKHSTDRAAWKCERNHRWSATVYERTVRGTGCPYCHGRKATPGVNDIETTHPDIAAQWMSAMNGDLTPRDVTITSGRKVWWRAEGCGHVWQGEVRYRTSAECARCARGDAVAGVNDVLTVRPDLGAYFDASRNPGVRLDERVVGSGRTIHWCCPACGHEWTSPIRTAAAFNEPCPRCDQREVTPGVNDAATLHKHLLPEVDEDIQPASVLVGMSPGNGARIAWKCAKGHTWTTRLIDRVNYNTGCPDCAANNWASRGEDEIAAFVESLGLTVERAKRLQRAGTRWNYDIYVPELDTYIEFNGLFFHCEAAGRGRDYHQAKLRVAKEQGATLLTVWEDDWRYKPETVRRFLAHKLGRSLQPKVNARATTPVMVDSSTAKAFLHEHHIQGPVAAGLRLALIDQDQDTVAVMLVRIQGAEATIQRYATACRVPGGFGKLLAHLRAHLRDQAPEVRRIKTFSDNLISDGTLYAAAGFVNDGQVPPDYTYFRGKGPRIHKFNLRIARFRKDPTLVYQEGLTEAELATLNKFHRVWDAGKTRWILPVATVQ